MSGIGQDFRIALRMLMKSPGFSAVAVLTLALGIGATTAIFSVVNAVLLHPLPYSDPDRLVLLWGNVRRTVVERRGASFPDYLDWHERSRAFEGMAAVWSDTVNLYGTSEPERLSAEVATGEYFSLLGVNAQSGRVFLPEEDVKPESVVVLGAGLWKRRFGSDPQILGKVLQLDDARYTVVGVVPETFRGMSDDAELWLPATASAGDAIRSRGNRWFPAVARLKPGVTLRDAQTDLDGISRELEKAYPDTNEGRAVEVAGLRDEIVSDLRPVLVVILAAVSFVLLIACANVANLLLARAETRHGEMSIRAALGARRGRLLRQLCVESLTLTFIGAALGVLLALWGTEGLIALSPVPFPSFVDVRIDRAVLLFTLLVSVLTGLALGAAPAFFASGGRLAESLRESSGRSGGGSARQRLRTAIVVAEVALAVVLLVGAGLFIESFRRLALLDPGFRTDGILSLRVSLTRPTSAEGSGAQTLSLSREIKERLEALPSVDEVALASDVPLGGSSSAIFYTAEGQQEANAQTMPRAYVHRVTPGFFKVLGTRLLQGRDFSTSDLESRAGVVIISSSVARRFWPGESAVGKRIKAGGPTSQAPWLEIVGVVDEVNYRALPRNPTADPDLYFPFNLTARQFAVLLSTTVNPSTLSPSVQTEVRRLDPSAVFYDLAPMTDRLRSQVTRPRFASWVMGIFAVVALLLALVGVYGVMAHAVTSRKQEIGIRMALGAGERHVVMSFVLAGLLRVGLGLGIGLAGAAALTRLVESLLFGVLPTEPVVFAGGALVLLLAALVAAYIPARRAARVDPVVTLRYE